MVTTLVLPALALGALLSASGALLAGDGGDLFLRGDANADTTVNIGDPVYTLAFLFTSGPAPVCLDAADSNDDGSINIGDPVSTLAFLFSGAGPLPPPSAAPGVDPTPDGNLCGPGCTDVWYLDADQDSYGDPSETVVACVQPPGYADNDNDCDDTNADVYVGAPEFCDGLDNDCDQDVDEGGVCSNPTSLQILAARNAPDGPVAIEITDAYVTHTKPTIGNDPAGFFVQAEQGGPALFVQVDPASVSPLLDAGDLISFEITEMGTAAGLRQALAITGVGLTSTGGGAAAVAFLIQDVYAVDLPLFLADFESELVTATVEIAAPFAPAGTGFVSALVDSGAVIGSPDLRLRLPATLAAGLLIGPGCEVTVTAPLWRFNTQAQLSAWDASAIVVDTCPPIELVSAAASSATEVELEFDRLLDAGSVLANGSQFVLDGGLVASAAAVTGPATIAVTTSPQVPGASYTITVAASVLDQLGQGVSATANSAAFAGYQTPAIVRINELNANVSGGCDLLEIRVVQGGSLGGFSLLERTDTILTFPAFSVATNDIILVHFDSADLACNPNASGSETASPAEFPAAGFPGNYDSAFDWHIADTGLTATDNVLWILDPLGGIVDAVLVSDDPTGTAAAASETAAVTVAASLEWTTTLGTIPPGGFVDDDFSANAVLDLNGTSTTQVGTSIQRSDDTDTNHLVGWGMSGSSWGTINSGQVPF